MTAVGGYRSNVVKIFIANLPLKIDSIVMGDKDTTFRNADSIYTYMLDSAGSSVKIQVHVRDLNIGTKQALNPAWSSSVNSIMPHSHSDSTKIAYYQLHYPVLLDTVSLSVDDKNGSTVYKRIAIRNGLVLRGPVIDSVRIGATKYSSVDSIITINLFGFDTLHIGSYSHSYFSKDTLGSRWRSGYPARISDTTAAQIAYVCATCRDTLSTATTIPVDTLRLTISNTARYTKSKRVIINKIGALPPVVDSLKVQTTVSTTDTTVIYGILGFDTLTFRMYAHPAIAGDSIAYSWSAGTASRLKAVSGSNGTQIKYGCITCKDTFTSGMPLAIDTVTVRARDVYTNRAATRRFAIVKVPALTPVVDSLRVNDSLYTGTDSVRTYRAVVIDTVNFALSVQASAPTDTPVTVAWTARTALRLVTIPGTNGRSVRYIAGSRDTLSRDSVVIIDTVKATITTKWGKRAVRKIALRKVPVLAPVVDSIRVFGAHDTLFNSNDSLYIYKIPAFDSLAFRIFARGLAAHDTLLYPAPSLSSGLLTRLSYSTAIGNNFLEYLYICTACTDSLATAGTQLIDTFKVSAVSKNGKQVRKKIVIQKIFVPHSLIWNGTGDILYTIGRTSRRRRFRKQTGTV